MAKFGSRIDRLEEATPDPVIIRDVDPELLALADQNPCLKHHKSPPDVDPEEHLMWIDRLLEHHRHHGPCESRGVPFRNEETPNE